VGSLAGAAIFKRVTKIYKGKFKFCRNEFCECNDINLLNC